MLQKPPYSFLFATKKKVSRYLFFFFLRSSASATFSVQATVNLRVIIAVFADPCKINPSFISEGACSFFSGGSDLLTKHSVAISVAFCEEM